MLQWAYHLYVIEKGVPMKQVYSPRARSIAWLLTLVYFASYIMRINFAVMLVKICSEMALQKSDLAVVITGMTIFYGMGQIINGVLGDRIPPNRMLTVGLLLAASCNIGMFFCHTVPLMPAVWCLNGFAHAMLWPPIVRLMSTYLSDDEYGYASVRVSWGSSFATIALYLLCPLLLKVLNWRTIILTLAFVGIAVAIVWMLLFPRLFTAPRAVAKKAGDKKAVGEPLPRSVLFPVVLIFLGIVLQGMLRDGVTNWMPAYLLESFNLSEENSIFSTVILAIFSVFSFSLFNLLHRKFFRNEVTCSAVIFGIAVVSALLLYVLSLFMESVILSMLLMAMIVAAMHGINLMLITVVPKRFVRSGRVSTFSGILNAGTYVGASISTYGFAALAESCGWSFTILTWAIISAAGLAVCLVVAPLWKRFCRDYAGATDV